MHYRWPVLPVGTVYPLMNVPVFCLGWRFVGTRFALYSLWGIVICSVMLHTMTFQIEIADRMLSAVVAIMTAEDVTGVEVGNQAHW
jgi:uncharacterized membrane-anchored protein YitT (DUF2179 family)